MRRARLPPPRSHKCEAQDTLRHANLLNGGLAFATAKIHPSFVRFAHKFPPSFCLRSSRSLIRYRHVSAFGVHLLLRNSLCYLICPALRAVHRPPCPVLRTHPCHARVGYVSLWDTSGLHYVQTCYARRGRGFAGKPLKFQI